MSVLKKAIEALDPTPDKKKELTLTLNLLFELAEQKKQLQEAYLRNQLRTAGTSENPSIPITSTLAWHSETRAYVKDDAAQLATKVMEAIKLFITGGTTEILEGVGSLLSGAIEAILGAGEGTETEMHSYYIIVEAFSIIRFDVTAWQRHISVVGITQKIEHAMTFTAVKSSVDVDKITFNTFLQAYKNQLDKMKFGEHELIEFIKKAKEVFELLRDDAGTRSVVDTSSGRELYEPGTVKMLE